MTQQIVSLTLKLSSYREENWNSRKLHHMASNRQETRLGALLRFRDTVFFSTRCSQQQHHQVTFCHYRSSGQLGQADGVPSVTFRSHLLPSTVLDAGLRNSLPTATAWGISWRNKIIGSPQETRIFLFFKTLSHTLHFRK